MVYRSGTTCSVLKEESALAPWILWEVCVHSLLWWSQDILCCSIKSNNCIHAAAEDVQGEKVYWELLNVKPPLGPGDLSSWAVLVWSQRCQWSTLQILLLSVSSVPDIPWAVQMKGSSKSLTGEPLSSLPLIMCSLAALLLSLKPLKWVTGAAWLCVSVAYKSCRTHESSFGVVATWQHKSLRH